MQVSCLQENLSRGLGVVGRAVATRSPLPIMQNVLIQTDGSRLKLAATDAEIAITTWIGCQVEGEGGITAPARLLTNFVNSLPAERIDLEIGEGATGLALRCARVDANLNGIAADDFPPIPTTDEGVVGRIAASDLEKAITLVAFAAATEDSRPVLTGIKVEIEGDEATFAAADGFRLAVYKGKLAEPLSEDLGFIIPARALREINRLLAGRDEDVEFTVKRIEEFGVVPPGRHRDSHTASPGRLSELRPAHPTVLRHQGDCQPRVLLKGDSDRGNIRPRRQRHIAACGGRKL